MADSIQAKLDNYKTAPFDSRFPNQNQTRNCWQNYLDFHRCEKAMAAKGADTTCCQWYRRVYTSLCPISWAVNLHILALADPCRVILMENQIHNGTIFHDVNAWDERRAEGTFPGKI